jgi:hypothetical protein
MKASRLLVFLLFSFIWLYAGSLVALAAPLIQESGGLQGDPFFNLVLPLALQFASLAGFSALGTAAVNVGKWLGWVKDGQAPKASTLVHGLLFAVFVAMVFLLPNFRVETGDQLAGQLSQLLLLAGELAAQFGLGKVWHAGLKGVPVIGKSYSA